jgi:hypothetical protein
VLNALMVCMCGMVPLYQSLVTLLPLHHTSWTAYCMCDEQAFCVVARKHCCSCFRELSALRLNDALALHTPHMSHCVI